MPALNIRARPAKSRTAPISSRTPSTHIETVVRRVATTIAQASNALFLMALFKGSIDIEKIRPLEVGFVRPKFRRDRRPHRRPLFVIAELR